MANKQLSWRCSNQALSLLFLLLVPTNTLSMDIIKRWRYGIRDQDIPRVNLSDLVVPTAPVAPFNDGLVPEMTDEQKKSYVARGKTWQEMMEVFEDAPVDMQDIVDHLKKPTDPEWRAAFVVGPPGTGKTTASLAVPHLARWYWKFASGPELAGKYRNESKERLSDLLTQVVARGKKTVMIVDELNRLLENSGSKSHDTDVTGSFLWTFLDEHKRNPNFFFIGTMNRDDKLADPIKHRFGGSTIYFPPIEDPVKLLNIFKKVMRRNTEIELDKKCDDVFIQHCFDSLSSEGIDITPRDYENIRIQAARLSRRDDKVSPVRNVKRKHICKAVQAVAQTYERSKLGKEELTEEEWRDFNAVQSRIIEIKLNAAQTSQTSFGLTGIIPTFNRGGPVRFDIEKAEKIIEDEFSPDQIDAYRCAMKIKKGESLLARSSKKSGFQSTKEEG